MTFLGWLDTGLLVAATVADLVFLYAYMVGNSWWSSRVGKALVGLGGGMVLILGYAALKRLFGWPTVPALQLGLYGLVVLMLLGLDIAFARERRTWRKAHRKAVP